MYIAQESFNGPLLGTSILASDWLILKGENGVWWEATGLCIKAAPTSHTIYII